MLFYKFIIIKVMQSIVLGALILLSVLLTLNFIVAPSLFPIQFFCIVLTLSGHNFKSSVSLSNSLAKSDIFAENKLFATLDTTVRKVVVENLPFLLSDTVGFIRKLPHQLVESFKSTLDEVRESDLLIHVVDISNPNFEDQIKIVNSTIAEIGASNKPMLIIFNKIDAYTYIQKDDDDLTDVLKENLSET